MAHQTYPAFDRADAPHVVIIGGGITGLSAAFYLHHAARAARMPLSYTLVERDERCGGKIQTDLLAGADYGAAGRFVVEAGPDSFITQKPGALQLARDLGLEDQLMEPNEAQRKVYVLVKGKRHPLPDGLALIVPTNFRAFARSSLISPLGKLRMALDLLIPPKRDGADETLADFVRRRLGAEALDKIGEPLMAGIHSSESERQSLLATFPRFRTLEEQHGSLIRGMRAHRPAAGTRSPFATLRGGLGDLVNALVDALDGRLLNGRSVSAIDYAPTAAPAYHVRLDDGALLPADAVILTAPAFVAADLVAPFQPDLSAELRQIRYVTTATVSLAFKRADIGAALDGFGLLIPASEHRAINACTMTSIKFAHRAPDDHTLLRVFLGGSRNPAVVALDDPALLALVCDELKALFDITAEPVFTRIYRWPRANPQYDLGHLERVAVIERRCPPGLYLAGCAYRGVGIPDCIAQGRAAVARLITELRSHEHAHAMIA
jgi:protoporphyrinogen/coproporphyrinogen III oxidase